MLIALEPDSMMATICDQGFTKEIDLRETTVLGGGIAVTTAGLLPYRFFNSKFSAQTP